MNYNDEKIAINDLKAETLLTALGMDSVDWIVSCDSDFMRNYTEDVLELSLETKRIGLARNGIYDVLPEMIFFMSYELHGLEGRDFQQKDKLLHEKQQRVKDFFKPFDCEVFKKNLQLERVLNQKLADKTPELLLRYYGYDVSKETDRHARMLAPMILYSSKIRGNFKLMCVLLSEILECKVRHSIKGRTLRYTVFKEGLDAAGFLNYTKEIKPVFDMVDEWFTPFEACLEYKVKDYKNFMINNERPMVLDYNTNFMKQKIY